MRELLKEAVFILYMISSIVLFIIGLAFPLTIGFKDNPNWLGWVIYPLCFITFLTQSRCFDYFTKK